MDPEMLPSGQSPYELDLLLDEGAVDPTAAALAPEEREQDAAEAIDAQILALLVSP